MASHLYDLSSHFLLILLHDRLLHFSLNLLLLHLIHHPPHENFNYLGILFQLINCCHYLKTLQPQLRPRDHLLYFLLLLRLLKVINAVRHKWTNLTETLIWVTLLLRFCHFIYIFVPLMLNLVALMATTVHTCFITCLVAGNMT